MPSILQPTNQQRDPRGRPQQVGPGRQDLRTRGPAPGGGLLGRLEDSMDTPYDLGGLPEIRPTNIIEPTTSQVDVPGQIGAPQAGAAPTLGYQGKRVGAGPTYQAPRDVQGVAAGQQGQYGMNPNRQAVMPSRLIGGPRMDFGAQGNELERSTFQRGLNRIDPYMQEQRQGIAQRLQNQGLPVGSEAFNAEMDRFDRGRSDQLENLALSSVGAGRREQGRLFGQDLAGRQFMAGEQGRGFGERMASNQNQFGQGLAANQFNANESSRRFGELSGSQAQQYGLNLSGRQFDAGEAQRNFGNRLAGEGQYFGQRMAGDQFNAQQQAQDFQRRMASGQFGAQQQQQQFNNQFQNQGLLNQQDQFRSNQQGQQFNQDMARRQIGRGEYDAQRYAPYNEMQMLMGMVPQVGAPGFQQTGQYGMQAPNYGQYAYQQHQQNPASQGLLPELAGLAGMFLSNAKIGKLAQIFAGGGINWYYNPDKEAMFAQMMARWPEPDA